MRIPFISPAPLREPTPGRAALTPSGAPVWEGLSTIDRLEGLSPEARKRVHERNGRTRWRDVERYEDYLDRYLEGARRCRTTRELRAYGRPEIAEEGLEPDGTPAERLEFAGGPSQALKSRLEHAYREIGDLVLRLERRPVPLDVFFDVSATARAEIAGRSFGGTLSARGGGTVEGSLGGVVGSAAAGRRHEAGLDAGVAGVKASFVDGRIVGAEVSFPAAPGVTVHAKRTRGAVEHGISVGTRLGGAVGRPGVRVEARASLGVNLTTAEFIHRAIYGRSVFDEEK